VRQGAELVGLPENFSFLGKEEEKIAQAQTIAHKSEKFLKTMAQRFQVTIVGGGFPVAVNSSKVYNTALLVDPNGTELARYQKVHLFDVNVPDGNTYQESTTVMPGTQLPPVYNSEQLGTLGLSVCYDVRFPNFIGTWRTKALTFYLSPAAFTAYTGKDHWQVLLQARALKTPAM
jgi:predicted amidohydrolase